ncbi:hypothetical protein [Colwellia piezophila]|uniref:hypothetical protein n=1 Tax=Colwellia piezophila TaxID=211668 RepID=UPI00036AB455|nr:hypothetical protein [Colwellia piezophila]
MKSLLLCLACAVFTVNAGDYTTQFFAASYHPTTEKDLNKNHYLLGVEYIEDNIGYSLSIYKNSFYRTTVMYTQSLYIENDSNNYKFFLSVGAATGYQDTGADCLFELGNICSVLATGVIFTTYDIRPRITVLAQALVFSLEYKW